MFGWCMDNKHTECIEKFQRFYIGTTGRGRNKKTGPILLDEFQYCDCKCHKDKE